MNIWALLSFIAGALNLILGIYVCRRNPGKPLNRFFALTAFSFAIWGMSEFGHRVSGNPETALLCIKAGGFGWCFMVSFYTHFALLFARKTNFLKKFWSYIILYAPCFLFLYLFLTTGLIYKHEAVKMYWGYTALPGKLIWMYTSYYTIFFLWGIYSFIQVLRRGTVIERKQVKPILLGYSISWVIGTLFNVLFPLYGIPIPELGTEITIIWAGSAFYSIFRYKLFIIPVKESDISAPLIFNLEKGNIYFAKEDEGRAYKIFIDQISHGIPGLCFSKFPEEKIRDRYKILYTPIIWVTFKEREEGTIGYKDIELISSTILDFIEKTKTAVIIVDCLNEIIMVNGWQRVEDWLGKLKDKCKNSVLLFSIDVELLDADQALYLKENLKIIE